MSRPLTFNLNVLERHGYSRLVTEQQPAGDGRDRVQRSVDIVESRRNGPQPSMMISPF